MGYDNRFVWGARLLNPDEGDLAELIQDCKHYQSAYDPVKVHAHLEMAARIANGEHEVIKYHPHVGDMFNVVKELFDTIKIRSTATVVCLSKDDVWNVAVDNGDGWVVGTINPADFTSEYMEKA